MERVGAEWSLPSPGIMRGFRSIERLGDGAPSCPADVDRSSSGRGRPEEFAASVELSACKTGV
eukprot:366260-Chlamydomonas_euryale.AAC.12